MNSRQARAPFRWAPILWPIICGAVQAEPPVAVDPRLVVELVVREPAIVTPTGIAVDEAGKIWVIENHTHHRPPQYNGPATDRIRVFFDFDAAGKPRQVRTFAEGFYNSMSLMLGQQGAVYLATRSAIHLLRDTAGMGTATEQKIIVKLETAGNYPHNGLAGFALDSLGNLYFGLGENLGEPYKLIGSDATTLTGGGEGGSIYRCRPDGSKLARVATGFWNPYHMAFDAFGRLFAVDNDPDSRGPCRLMHIIPGGDYGYRYRNGRKGLHPFTAWNGELPGTLPMVAGTSEAPCAVLPYESDALPTEYHGQLFVTSWGDHVIERFTLLPRESSVTSQARPFVRGDENFRPVGLVAGPDGCLYVSDWVDKSYPVHGQGRIWRIRPRLAGTTRRWQPSDMPRLEFQQLVTFLSDHRQELRMAAADALAMQPGGSALLIKHLKSSSDPRARCTCLWKLVASGATATEAITSALADKDPNVRAEACRAAAELGLSGKDLPLLSELIVREHDPAVRGQLVQHMAAAQVVPILASQDPFLAGSALARLGHAEHASLLRSALKTTDAGLRLMLMLALRQAGASESSVILPRFLQDPDPEIRRAAIQWVAEERLRAHAGLLTAAMEKPPITRPLVEAFLAAQDFLFGRKRQPGEEVAGEEYVVQLLKKPGQSPRLQAMALTMLRPDHPALDVDYLRQLVAASDPELKSEAIHTLAMRTDSSSQALLRELAVDKRLNVHSRRRAIMGLGSSADVPATQEILFALLEEPMFTRDVLRSLRGTGSNAAVAARLLVWQRQRSNKGGEDRNAEEASQLALAQAGMNSPVSNKPHSTEGRWKLALRNSAERQRVLEIPGDAQAGEIAFFHSRGPRCSACHRMQGRGTALGPDLSRIGRSLTRDKLAEAMIFPDKEIAPAFTSWLFATRDGKTHQGLLVDEGPHSTIVLADNQGRLETIKRTDVEERRPVARSIMPDNLLDLMTHREFLDILAYLAERK